MAKQHFINTATDLIRIENKIPTISDTQTPTNSTDHVVLIVQDGQFVVRNGGFVGIKINDFTNDRFTFDPTESDPYIFDGYPEFSYFRDIKVVTLNNSGDETQELANYNNPLISGATDGTNGQVMVKFPKLYYKEFLDVNGVLIGIELARYQKPGMKLHPLFTWGNGRDYIYIGAYEGYLTGSMLSSISGFKPTTNRTIGLFRGDAINRGGGTQETSNWHLYSYWHEHFLNMLFYLYYGTRDSQAVLGGYTEGGSFTTPKIRTCGRTNILDTINGSVIVDFDGGDSDILGSVDAGIVIANRFLFVENFYGHIWKFLDGVGFDGRTGNEGDVWLSNDPRNFTSQESEILLEYTKSNTIVYTGGDTFVKELGEDLLPITGGGNSSTFYCDQFYSRLTTTPNEFRVVRGGGALAVGSGAGVAGRSSFGAFSISHSTVGSRLCYSEI